MLEITRCEICYSCANEKPESGALYMRDWKKGHKVTCHMSSKQISLKGVFMPMEDTFVTEFNVRGSSLMKL